MRIRVMVVLLAATGACSPPQMPPAPEPMDSGVDRSAPQPPTEVTGLAGRSQVEVSWLAPADNGGSPVTNYTVTSSPGGFVITTTTTRVLFTGLQNGTPYTFTVTATNSVGMSAPSEPSSPATPATIPSAPPSLIAMAGDSRAVVSWTRPIDNGGSAITTFLVHDTAGQLVATTNEQTTQATLNGLVNGTEYAFTVTAVNAIGAGTPSQFSNSVIPLAVPDQPTAVLATAGNASAVIKWTAPGNTGGGPITLYTVTSEPGGFSATTTGATQVTVQGLLNGTTYKFSVRASNAVGMGLPSAFSNAATPAAPPGIPSSVTAIAGNAEATVRWQAPFDDGGGAITSYTVTSDPGGHVANASGVAATVTGLTNGVSYTFTVRATNWAGTGLPSSPSLSVTPLNVPSAPTQVVATRGDRTATVTWDAPADLGGTPIISYTVTSLPDGRMSTVSGATTTAVVSGLSNGTSYTFSVTATNAVGQGPSSSASNAVVPAGVPFAPIVSNAIPGDGEATISWLAANDNGAPISEYRVVSTPGNFSATTTGTSVVVPGLTNGIPYSFTVTATNLAGTSAPSTPSGSIVPAGIPRAPLSVVATPSDGRITLSWLPPSSNGSAITRYTVTQLPGGQTSTTAASPAVISGLTNGTPYTFTVSATNSVGTGPESAPVTARPAAVPGVPTGVTAIGATAQATVSWTAPSFDGGSAITGYVITSVPAGLSVTVGLQTQVTLSGLVLSASYAFRVRAINAAGQSADSAPSNTVALFSAVCAGMPVLGGQLPQIVVRSNPTAVGLADLNGDGAPDLLSADQNSGQLTVFRGKGGGTFDDGVDFSISAGSGTRSFATADFNDDGRVDVAIANTGANFVTVWLTGSNGTLSTRLDSPSLGGITSLATGDFDRDGHVDLVASNGAFTFMRGTGTGEFASTATTQAGRAVVSGEFDGDGILDVLSISSSNGPRISRGVGDGTFLASYAVAAISAGAVTTLDQNGDGRLDVALAHLSGSSVSVALNGGGGTFLNPLTYANGLNAPTSILASDVTGDGRPDLVTSSTNGMSVLVALGGGYDTPRTNSVCGGLRAIALGDLTRDGSPDLIAACAYNGPSVLQLIPGRADGTFPLAPAKGSTGQTPIAIATGDFNSDGLRDVATANYTSSSVSVMLGMADGEFGAPMTYTVGGEPMFIVADDVTGDGRADLVITNRASNNVSILRGQPNGTFQPVTFPTGGGASSVAIGDFNADGLTDLAVAAFSANAVTIMLANGSGGFINSSLGASGGPHSVAPGDLNGDGKKDLVVALWDVNRIGVFLGNGNGTFGAMTTYPVSTNPRAVALEDFNGDGRLDVAVAHYNAAVVGTLLGNGDGTFQPMLGLVARSGQASMLATDFDSDGKIDLIAPNWNATSVSIYKGRGDGTFWAAAPFGISGTSNMVIADDMNADGSKDLVVVNSTSANFTVLLKTGCLP